jgi:hypothetical protein
MCIVTHVSSFNFFAVKALGTAIRHARTNRIIHEADWIVSSFEFWTVFPNRGWPLRSIYRKVSYEGWSQVSKFQQYWLEMNFPNSTSGLAFTCTLQGSSSIFGYWCAVILLWDPGLLCDLGRLVGMLVHLGKGQILSHILKSCWVQAIALHFADKKLSRWGVKENIAGQNETLSNGCTIARWL